MKRFVFAIMLVLAIVGFAAATVSAEGPAKPVIEGGNAGLLYAYWQ